jgi:hypothetical protein
LAVQICQSGVISVSYESLGDIPKSAELEQTGGNQSQIEVVKAI